MEATQLIDDSILEEDEKNGERRKHVQGQPLAKLRVLKNEHFPETELLLYRGDNVMGRDPASCSLTLQAQSVSKQHAVISISVFRGNRRFGKIGALEMETLVWDLGSMNGTKKGWNKLTPHVRYALTDGDGLVLADIPCQYVSLDKSRGQKDVRMLTNGDSGRLMGTEPELIESPGPRSHGLEQKTGPNVRQNQGCVVVEMEASLSTELGGTTTTPPRTMPLSFEQTPTQSGKILVSDSESDSDGVRDGRRDKVSNSDSLMSSSTCSKFLSPNSKVIPESEDEDPISPFSAKDTPNKRVTLSEEDSDVDEPRLQPRNRRAPIVVEEEEEKEVKEAPGEKEMNVSIEVADRVGPADRDGCPTSGPVSSTETRLMLNLDSDTDIEDDDEGSLSAPVNGVEPPATTRPDPGLLRQRDSEEGDTVDRDSNIMLSGADLDRVPAVQPTDPHLDHTDVDAATKVRSSISNLAKEPDASASVVQPVELHLDSDTDVEEDTNPPESVYSRIRTAKAGHRDVLLDTDTKEEKHFSLASGKTAAFLNPQSTVAAALEIRSDSETEPEEETTTPPFTLTTSTRAPTEAASSRSQSSNADTDVEDERLDPTAELVPESDLSETGDFRMDSDTDVEEDESGPGERGCTTKGTALPSSPQKCSTPLASSVQEEMETQDFSSLLDPFRRPALHPVLRPNITFLSSSSASDSQKDEDSVVAETQSFVLEAPGQERQSSLDPTLEATRPCRLSASSHLQPQAEVQAVESTEGELEATQDYAAVAQVPTQSSRPWAAESTHTVCLVDGDSDVEATQAYFSGGDSEELGPGRRSAVCGRDRREDFALEATQAYANQPCSDTEEEDTQPLEFPTVSCVATADTLPMSAYEEEEEEEDVVGAMPSTPVRRGGAREQDEQETQTDVVLNSQFTSSHLSTAETLPVFTNDDDDDDNDQYTSSHLSTAETLPVFTNDDDDDEESEEREEEKREEIMRLEQDRIKQDLEKQDQEKQDQEKQDPEKQDQEKQDQEKQDQEKQDPEKQDPEKQDQEKQDPEKQDPEKQDQEKQDQEKQDQEKQDQEKQDQEKQDQEKQDQEKQERTEREQRVVHEREERERMEREKLEKKEKEQFDWEIKERNTKDTLKRDRKTQGNVQEVGEGLKMETREDEAKQERDTNQKRKEKEAKNEPETMKGRRATSRRVSAVPPKINSPCRDPEPTLASRTRSRSNLVSSGSSRGRKTTVPSLSEPVHDTPTQSSTRKTTVPSLSELVRDTPTRSSTRKTAAGLAVAPSAVAEVTMQDLLCSKEAVARRTRSRSCSTSSQKSDASVVSVNAQSRGRKAETDLAPPREQPLGPKATRDRGQKAEDHAPGPKREQKQVGGTTRGRRRTAKSRKSVHVVEAEETLKDQITEDCLPASGNGGARGQRGNPDTPPEPSAAPSDEGEPSKTGGRWRKKRELEEEEDNPCGFKVPRLKVDFRKGARCGTTEETKDKEKPASPLETSKTPTGKGRGKRCSSQDVSTVAKTPRSSLASSSASPLSCLSPGPTRARAPCNTIKVLFTGVVDEEGEKLVCRLGGSLAKGVADMTHLVTDRVRRTVKFLCAVSRGVPIVTTDWLDKCGKAGSFLSTDRFLVKDQEQETKFSFCLRESLRIASTQQLLQGYHVHVTRSVQPEPAQMKIIITCCGARILTKMPSAKKPQTVVISCGEDWSLCAPALSASLPVLTAEFLLTGILQQRVDLITHILSAP